MSLAQAMTRWLLRSLIVPLVIGVMNAEPTLTLQKVIPLPGVEGRMDHFAFDAERGRLFVAALGNHTVEVIDLRDGTVVRSLQGLDEPQGLAYVNDLKRLYVADGGDGAVHVFDGDNFSPGPTISFGSDADNLRYDLAARLLYVGYGSGGLGVIDPAKNQKVGDIALKAHPESFQLETTGGRIFVNLPGAHTIGVVDRTASRVTGTWSLGLAGANFPMALDEANHRLFVGCRIPSRLLVFDTETGQEIAKLDLHGDCDDLFLVARSHQLLASCGEGFIDVFAVDDPRHYERRASLKTAGKARTSYLVDDRLFLAVPKSGSKPAEIREYLFQPQ